MQPTPPPLPSPPILPSTAQARPPVRVSRRHLLLGPIQYASGEQSPPTAATIASLPFLAALAACAPSRATDRRGPASPTAPSGGTPTPTARRATPVPLEMWLPGRQADATALEPFHAEFLAETPGAAAVTVQLVTNEDMMDRLTAALASGTPPDVARLKEYRLADLGARGALLPLDALVAADREVRLADFTTQSVDGSRHHTTSSPRAGGTAAAGTRSSVDRPLLGVPDSHQIVALFWNRELLAHAGLDPDTPPASWETLRRGARAVQALTGAAVGAAAETTGGPSRPAGTADPAAARGFQFYEFSQREQTYCWFIEWVWRAGGEVWAGMPGTPSALRATLDTPAAARALQFQVDLLHADRTAVPVGTPVPELIANVAQGRVGYWMTTANAALTYARTAPGLRFGMGPLPPDQRDAHQLQHNALSVFAGSRAPDLAYRLVSYRSRAGVQARWAADGAWLPVRPSLWSRPPFAADPLWREIGALVHRPANRTKPTIPEWDAFTAAILPPLLAAWQGDLAPRGALLRAQHAANTRLATTP